MIPRFAAIAVLLVPLLAPGALAKGAVDQVRADLDQTMAYLADFTLHEEDLDEVGPYLVEAAVAAGLDPARWPQGKDALSLVGTGEPAHPGLIYLLRPAHALALAGRLGPDDARTKEIQSNFVDGQYGEPGQVNDDMWVLLTLPLAGIPKENADLQASATGLIAAQDRFGAWAWNVGGSGATDETAMALEALQLVGRLDKKVADSALGFITDQTYPSGGVALVKPATPNCDSTVWAVRGHVAAGYDPPSAAFEFLAKLRNADGSYDFIEHGEPAILCTLEVATLLGTGLQKGWFEGSTETAQGADGPSVAALLAVLAAGAVSRVIRKRL